MKNEYLRNIFVLLFIGFVSVGNLYSQSSNNEQRIVGSWTVIISDIRDYKDSIWTFNANGTLNIRMPEENLSVKYFVAGSKIHIENFGALDIYFSIDGRVVILSGIQWGISLRKN